MNTAIFPGVFDPPTTGHIELIQRAANLYDKLYVGVVVMSSKRVSFFGANERQTLLQIATAHFKNVEVVLFTGLIVDYAKAKNIDVIVRGIRNGTDFEYEYQMAAANRIMTGIETVFLAAAPSYVHLSSTLIREIGVNGRRLHGFVPEVIEEAVFKKLSC